MRYNLNWMTRVLVISGAINWGLIGLLKLNVIEIVFGVNRFLLAAVYTLIGLSGLYQLYRLSGEKR